MKEVHHLPDPADLKPTLFAVETVLGCDLKCPECAVGGGFVRRKKGVMSLDRFKIIADKIRPYCDHLYLHIWGEPMLNPDIYDMIRYAARFTRTNISTNGKQLSDGKAEKLIASGVSEVIVSIDGVTQEVYEQYRAGGCVEKAVNALARLQHYNQIYGRKVQIIPQFIVMRHNQHEMDHFRRLCHSMDLQPTFKAPYIRNPKSKFRRPDLEEYHRPTYADTTRLKAAMAECNSVRRDFNILLDGTVVICCHDYGGFTNFGNIFERDVMEIWNSGAYAGARLDTMSSRPPKFCLENCMSYFLDPLAKDGADTDSTESHVPLKINLCSGPIKVKGYVNIDQCPDADMVLDLEHDLLPFPENSADVVTCISAINYFDRERALEIVADTYRVLKPGGVARFASQDLRILTDNYLRNDIDFYFQKLPNGNDRFPGVTIGDKLNAFFYGFKSGQKHCKYVYDYETLACLFREAGFSEIVRKNYRDSLIDEVDLLDNRPKQMFFLEAVKGGGMEINASDTHANCRTRPSSRPDIKAKAPRQDVAESEKANALKLWVSGEREKAWQLFVQFLEHHPGDREIACKCIDILEKEGRFADMARLCCEYLTVQPEDVDIQQRYRRAKRKENENLPDQGALHRRRIALENRDPSKVEVHDERRHLDACMNWLVRAQDANRGGGVSAMYQMDTRRWHVDYPETTGYIITTFLSYYHLCGDDTYLQRAMAMGDWEISIQTPQGGVGEPVGVYGQKPRIFNTGQVMLGWLALFHETRRKRYLEASIRAADWIVAHQDDDGKWTRSTYRGPKSYHSRVTWALAELYKLVGTDRYRSAITNSLNWILSNVNGNGWFAANSLSEPGKPWTHLTGYVLVGLMKICRLTEDNPDFAGVRNLLHVAARGICASFSSTQTESGTGRVFMLPATFDENWSSSDQWSCLTGNAQTEYFLRSMYGQTGDLELKNSADLLLTGLKQCHLLDGFEDRNINGGLPGSHPIGGPYLSYAIPNWGVKFFADSLIRKIAPIDTLHPFLG